MSDSPGGLSASDAMTPREPVRYLVFAASLRAESLNLRLARLAARTIEQHGGTVDLASMRDFDAPSYNQDVEDSHGLPARRSGVPPPPRGQRRLRHRLPRVQRLDAGAAQERHRLGLPVPPAAVQRPARPAAFGLAIDGRRQPGPLGAPHPAGTPGRAGLPGHVLPRAGAPGPRPGRPRFSTSRSPIASSSTIVAFMDLVEAAKHYPVRQEGVVRVPRRAAKSGDPAGRLAQGRPALAIEY